ncbi:MAG: hypothetical protein DMD81_25015, partial [Candidatus Rokuibacteriota bacterium]
QATFVMERLMDMGARRLGLDPVEIRRRNFVPPAVFPYRSAGGWELDSGRYADGLARALESARYGELRAWQKSERANGRLIGIGLSCYVEFTGMGPSRIMAAMGNRQGGYETAVVRVDPSGHATVTSGIIEIGQGIRSAMAQIAADILGLPYENVRVVLGHTALTPYSAYGTAGSRGAVVAGGSVLEASRLVKDKATRIAAHLLEAAAADIEVVDGRYRVRGAPSPGLTLAEIAREAHRGQRLPDGLEPGLEARYVHQPKNWTFSSGVHVAAVEVDGETGTVRIVGYWIAHDCGKVINPMLVDGQIHGGVAQGVGAALMEEIAYDDAGQLLSRTFMDYALPIAASMPEPVLEHLETPSPHTPGGVKGMSEGGTVAPPAAIANAVADALAGRGVDAAAVNAYPLTAPRVFELLRACEERARPRASIGLVYTPTVNTMSRQPAHVYVIQGRTPADYADCQAALASVPATMTTLPFLKDEEEIVARTRDADALVVVYSPITRRVMSALEGLKVVVRTGVGYDVIDVPAATELGVIVVNIPDLWIREVANHAMALLLAWNRKVIVSDRQVHAGAWGGGVPGDRTGALHGETVGIVGLGNIGSAFARRAAAFEMKVIACDPYVDERHFAALGVERVSLEQLAARSDYVSVHTLLNDETRHLISDAFFRRMKPTAILINTSRGPVVDERALIRALGDKLLAGAALDVWEHEPVAADNPLLKMENVIATPHSAYFSSAAVAQVPRRCGEEAARVLTGQRPLNVVNPAVYEPGAARRAG